MTRIDVVHGGRDYTLADTGLDELKDRIAAVAAGGEPFWLRASAGSGSFREVDLLISATTDVALVPRRDDA